MSKHSTPTIFSFLTLTTLTLAIPSHAATLNNGSFENNLNHWDSAGDVSLQTSTFGSGVPEGAFQALLTTSSQFDAGSLNFSGNDPTYVGFAGGLEEFLGLPFGSLDPDPNNLAIATEGSALKQIFTVRAGDLLTLDWNFLTNDSTYEDYAFIVLNSLSELANTKDATDFANLSTGFNKETGFKTFSYTFTTAGAYTLGLGVVDVEDTDSTSALLVDNVRLTSTSAKVPEPTSAISLLGLGAFGTNALLRRKQGQKNKQNAER